MTGQATNNATVPRKMIYPEGKKIPYTRFATLLATGAALPEKKVTNQDIIDRFNIISTDRAVQFAIGIHERRQADPAVSVTQYLAQAARDCLDRAGVCPEQLSRIVYARLMGERFIPSNASQVVKLLGIQKGIPVMDISAACSGFLHALDIGLTFIDGGDDYVLVLGGDRAGVSPIAKNVDTRTVFLNGDGFAAALLGVSSKRKFLAHYFYTDSSISYFASVPFGTALLDEKGTISSESFSLTMPDGPKIYASVLESCSIIAGHLLAQSGLTISDIDFFITSDQTAVVWRDQLKKLGIPESKSVSCFHKYGNTVAAMAPLNLHEALVAGKIQRGMKVMLMAHGAGASGGGTIFEY